MNEELNMDKQDGQDWEGGRGTADDADLRRFYFGKWTLAKIAKVAKKRK